MALGKPLQFRSDPALQYLVVTAPDGQRIASTGWHESQSIPQPGRDMSNPDMLHVSFPVALGGQSYGDLHYGLSLDFLEKARAERWLVSYADFITLLFAFFVVMYAISSVNEGKYKVLSNSLVNAFKNTTGQPGGQPIDRKSTRLNSSH